MGMRELVSRHQERLGDRRFGAPSQGDAEPTLLGLVEEAGKSEPVVMVRTGRTQRNL